MQKQKQEYFNLWTSCYWWRVWCKQYFWSRWSSSVSGHWGGFWTFFTYFIENKF